VMIVVAVAVVVALALHFWGVIHYVVCLMMVYYVLNSKISLQ
jgi:hypothetical protein